MTRTRKTSKSQQAFYDYVRYITIAFLEKFGPSYTNQENTRNQWRYDVDYSDAARDFLVFKSQMFYHKLDDKCPETTDPHFLTALATKMADYLSAYTMRRHVSGDMLPKERKEIRKIEKETLLKELYTKCEYIQNLLQRQAEQREERKMPKRDRFAKSRQNIQKRKKQDKAISIEITSIFIEVGGYGTKRH